MLEPFSQEAVSLKPGVYQHYSGKQYEVLGMGRHSESLEELVVYRALYEPYDIWVRPLGMFLEEVVIDGTVMLRFTRL